MNLNCILMNFVAFYEWREPTVASANILNDFGWLQIPSCLLFSLMICVMLSVPEFSKDLSWTWTSQPRHVGSAQSITPLLSERSYAVLQTMLGHAVDISKNGKFVPGLCWGLPDQLKLIHTVNCTILRTCGETWEKRWYAKSDSAIPRECRSGVFRSLIRIQKNLIFSEYPCRDAENLYRRIFYQDSI